MKKNTFTAISTFPTIYIMATINKLTIKEAIGEFTKSFIEKTQKPLTNLTGKTCKILIVDRSGSTGNKYKNSLTILDKEVFIAMNIIQENTDPNIQFVVISFDHTMINHGVIEVMRDDDEIVIGMPKLSPGGSTCTDLALAEAVKVMERGVKVTDVIIITDGQTNSSTFSLQGPAKKLDDNGVSIKIIAVTYSSLNPETLSKAEERNIPGMDVVNMLQNFISRLEIYTPDFEETPYIGAVSSRIVPNKLSCMDIPIPTGTILINYIPKAIDAIVLHKLSGQLFTTLPEFRSFCIDIGKLISPFFVKLPENNEYPWLDLIINKLSEIYPIDNIVQKIKLYLNYGFKCSKENTPIINTNPEDKVKESSVRKAEFSEASRTLETLGTTAGCDKVISLPINGVCILADVCEVKLTTPLGKFPNSKDGSGTIYLPASDNPALGQIKRQGIRGILNELRFPDASGCPDVIFYIANQLFLMYLNGMSLDTEHTQILKELAITQMSMNVLVSQGKYSSDGVYQMWSKGEVPKTHFSKPTTHLDLYTNKWINPLGLSQPIWWASMMSVVDLFDKQLPNFKVALESIGIELSKDAFLQYMKNTYGTSVKGLVKLIKIKSKQDSIITLLPFEKDAILYKLKDHSTPDNTYICKVGTIYERSEKDYVKGSCGCVWCHAPVTEDQFELFVQEDNTEMLKQAYREAIPLVVNVNSQVLPTSAPAISVVQAPVVNQSEDRKVVVVLTGITGAGKSTTSELIKKMVTEKGGKFHRVSADEKSKQGYKGKALQDTISREIYTFDREDSKLKVIVLDLCNENGVGNEIFGFNFGKYERFDLPVNYIPGQFELFENWCLFNVLSRKRDTPQVSYWLNPESAGVNTCIKVHNAKTLAIRRLYKLTTTVENFNENSSMTQIMNKITPKANAYAEILKQHPLEQQIRNVLTFL